MPPAADSQTPHDALFKWTFSDAGRAAAELRAVLPPELLGRVDLSTLEPCPAELVDTALAASYSDLLFRVRIAGRPGLLYVLFEHQSRPDPLMPLRLLGYMVRVLELHARGDRDDGEPRLPLPVVIPVVLHHSEQGWQSSTRFENLFDPELISDPAVAALVPRFEFVLDDISRLSDQALRARALDQVTRLALWALRDARNPERLLSTARGFLRAVRELRASSGGLEALAVIVRYFALVTRQQTAENVVKMMLAGAPALEATMTTLAERWMAEGRAEGEARGRLQGQRDLLAQLLSAKFGDLPEPARKRIATATEADLACWTARTLRAGSLADVFAESA